MNIRTAFVILAFFCSLSCSAQTNFQSMDAGVLVSDTKIPNDQYEEVKHLEEIVKTMQAKKEEQEKLLEHYENKSYLYGRQAQDLKSHCQALIRNYRQAVEEANASLDNIHREIVSTQK